MTSPVPQPLSDERRYFCLITVSDTASQGQRLDTGGDLTNTLLQDAGFYILHRMVLPDERQAISSAIQTWSDSGNVGLVVTTGGTGLGPRDVTPEATRDVCEYEVQGMAEAMRAISMPQTPFAMLSRQVVGVRNKTLIINLPGSPKAIQQCLEVIAPVLGHAVNLLHGNTSHLE